MRKGTLYGVGVGPGDPELITVKALRVIRESPVVAVPNSGHEQKLAQAIAGEYLQGKRVLECKTPMTRDAQALHRAHEQIAADICVELEAGQDVAYLTLGDVCVYSTYIYVERLVAQKGYATRFVPGITSFSASAAALGIPLCEGPQMLTIVPHSGQDLDAIVRMPGTKVFMKAGSSLPQLRMALEDCGCLDAASLVANCGLPDQQVYPRFADAPDDVGYFSLVILRETGGK